MDIEQASRALQNYKRERLCDIGRAIDALHEEHATYGRIAEEVGVGAVTIGKYHRLSRLPRGIQWKIEQGQLSRGHAQQICRLEDENDQWMLALAIVEATKQATITRRQCQDAVEDVLGAGKPMEQVLCERFGIELGDVVSLLLPVPYWFRLRACRAAWNREKEWKDLAFQVLEEWLDGREFVHSRELRDVARELVSLGQRLAELAE